MIKIYTAPAIAQPWLDRHCLRMRGESSLNPPLFACVLGFTATGLIEGISAAGATAAARTTTAIADAEFLALGATISFPLPPLIAGASPVLISRAAIAELAFPYVIIDAGLPIKPTIPHLTLGNTPAQCLSTGQALSRKVVTDLFWQGYKQGQAWAESDADYLILSECVVGGTTTALAVLTALGFAAHQKVNSSHPICNHEQKWQLVQQGLNSAGWIDSATTPQNVDPENPALALINAPLDPFAIVAAVGDPMQITVAGMVLGAIHPQAQSSTPTISGKDILLAGGTQMLAVYALAARLAAVLDLPWLPERIIVGTTRWVAEDPTGNTVALAEILGNVPLVATQLSFADSIYEQLRAYERGFVKEGVGAGGAAIAASLWANWGQTELLNAVEVQMSRVIAASQHNQ
ncbi:MAG: TIGR00303 family protein [Pseudanabaena sp. ELA607]